jgi:hypothetical protein
MTDKIIIFNTTLEDDSADIKDDKELFYEEWGGSRYTADTFYQMIKYENDNSFTNSTINTVLIRQIIDYITPIIEFIPLEEKVERVVYKNIRPKKADIKISTVKKKITFKVENNIYCRVNKSNKDNYIVVSKGSTIDIIGFELNKNIKKHSAYIYHYFTNLENGIKTRDLINAGVITLFNYLDNSYFDFGANVDFSPNVFYFDDIKGDITSVLNMIIKLIKVATDYYDKNNNNLYKTIHLLGFNWFNNIKPINQKSLQTPKCETTIKKMNSILEMDFCYSNNDNIIQNLYNTGYYEYYNKLKIGDTDTYSKLKYMMTKREDMIKQANLIHQKKYKKKKSYVGMTDADIAKIIALNVAIDNDDKAEIKAALAKKPTVCEHLIHKAELLLKDEGKTIVQKNTIIRNSLLSHYADTILDGYFCKLCGEELAKMDFTSQINQETRREYTNESYNELQIKIYREISYIVTNFVDFGKSHMHSISGIIKNITDVVKEEIHTIEIGLLKIKTLQANEVDFTLGIYIYIYAFAFISQLIYLNDTIAFKKSLFHGGRVIVQKVTKVKKVPKIEKTSQKIEKKLENTAVNGKNLQKIINNAILILTKIKSNDIQKSKVISSSSVKDLFLKAYRWVLNINYSTMEYSKAGYWSENNNIIDYFVYAWMRDQKRVPRVKGKPPLESSEAQVAIMGRSFKTIESDLTKGVDIYDTIVKPEKWSDNPYYNDSLLAVYDYINGQLYLENALAQNSALTEYYKKYAYLHELQREVQKQNKIREIAPFSRMPIIPYKSTKNITVVDFCNCPDSKYFYKKINKLGNVSGVKREYSHKDIKDWIEVKDYKKINEYNSWVVVDITCPCKKRKNESSNISVFYKFYEYKCPVGDIHEFTLKNNTECGKCHFTQDFMDNLNPAYYKKYVNVYETIKKQQLSDIKQAKHIDKKSTKKDIVFTKWVKDLSAIKKLVNLLGLSPNLVNNLGLYENKEWTKNITDLSIGLTENEILKQNGNLYMHYLFIIRTYYFVRGSEQSASVPEYLEDFLRGFSNIGLVEKFPMINENFQDMYNYYKKHMSAELNTNFLLHSIANTLMQILAIYERNNLAAAGKKFVRLIFDKMISVEKKLTKFDITKILKFGRKVDVDEDDIDVVDFEVVDPNADFEIIDVEKDYDEEAEQDIFSINDIDIEMGEEMDEDNLYTDVQDRMN